MRPIALELGGEIYVPLHDARGSVRTLLHSTDVQCARYSAFGEGSPVGPYAFLSKRLDEETGLIFFGRRYYDPSRGRWLTPDPLGPMVNPYAYALNRPTTQLDLYGLESIDHPNSGSSDPWGWGMHNPFPFHPAPVGGSPPFSTTQTPSRETTPVTGRHLPRIETSTGTPYASDVTGPSSSKQKAPSKPRLESRLLGTMSPLRQIAQNVLSERCKAAQPTCYSVGNLTTPDYLALRWINGLNNSLAAAKGHARYLSDLIGGYQIGGIHNPTQGVVVDAYIADQVAGLHIIPPSGWELMADMHSHYDQVGKEGVYLLFCQSHGTTIVRNVLECCPEHIQKMVRIIAVAPHCFIAPDLCDRVVHIVSWSDPLWYTDPVGWLRSRRTVVYVPRAQGEKWPDHYLQSESYPEEFRRYYTKFSRPRL